MSKFEISYPPGATPIDPDELRHLIPEILIGNTQFWIDNNTFNNDEIAARFHHRLVQVHVFTNGNGRHARLMTDLLLQKLGENKFTWGTLRNHTALEVEGKTRSEYIVALRKADKDDFAELIKFVRS